MLGNLIFKNKKSKNNKRVGYDPAIGATIAVSPLLIPKLKLNSAIPVKTTAPIRNGKAPLKLGFFNFNLLIFMNKNVKGKSMKEI